MSVPLILLLNSILKSKLFRIKSLKLKDLFNPGDRKNHILIFIHFIKYKSLNIRYLSNYADFYDFHKPTGVDIRSLYYLKRHNMKQLFIFTISLIFVFQAYSKNRIEVETGSKKMSKGEHTAFTVVIPDTKADEIKVLWNKEVNNRKPGERINNLNTQIANIFRSKEKRASRDRLKMEEKGNELYIRSVEIDPMANSPMDVYALVSQTPDGSQLSAFFQYTDSVFIDEGNAAEERFAFLKDYVRNFGVNAYKNIYDDSIKQANREVSREENRLRSLQSDINREEKAILRNEQAIENFKQKITEIQSDSARLINSLELKENELAEMNEDSAEYYVLEKELRDLQRTKQRYARELVSLKNRIQDKESDIETAKNQIASNQLQMESQKELIENKQQVAQELMKEKEEIE
jgi:hypothetical protein